MARYSVSGTLTPDATTADTGEPAGTFGGQPYWRWLVGEQEWFLFYRPEFSFPPFVNAERWVIGNELNTPAGFDSLEWHRLSNEIAGDYAPSGTTGTATVAEITGPPPATEYAVLQINDGPLAGEYIVLKTR